MVAEVRAGMSWRQFINLVSGLSDNSRWRAALVKMPTDASTPEAIAAITGSYYGPKG